MKPQQRVNWIGAVICALLFASSFVAAPHSCDGGLEAYVLAGVASVVALFMVPLVQRTGQTLPWRVAMGMGFAAIGLAVWFVGLAVWFVGLFAANVRIMCRLF